MPVSVMVHSYVVIPSTACDGDYSGIAVIGKFVGFFVLLFVVLWLFTQPVLLIIAIVVLVLIVIGSSAK